METVRQRPALITALLVGLWAPALMAKSKSSVDASYVSALATANRFLQAWQAQDHETGLIMLTDAVKRAASQDRLQNFFSPGPDAAYTLGQGKKVKVGRYSFPVALYRTAAGRKGTVVRPWYSQLVVVRAGKNDWAIDKLP